MNRMSVTKWMALALMVALLLTGAATAETLYTPADYPLEWYQTQPENVDPTRAYVAVTAYAAQVRLKQNAAANNELRWHTAFSIQERNGIPFTLTKQTTTLFDASGEIIAQELYAQEDIFFYESHTLEDGNSFEWGALTAPCDARWYTLCAEGVDANGNELAFGGVIELLEEVEAVPERADFEVEQIPVEGKAFIRITCPDSPVRYTPSMPELQGEPGYEMATVYENTGNSAFTITQVEYALFNGDAFFVNSFYDGETVAEWRGEGGNVLQPGESWTDYTYEPVMDFDTIFTRVTGLDESGEEMTFVGRIDLLREAKP